MRQDMTEARAKWRELKRWAKEYGYKSPWHDWWLEEGMTGWGAPEAAKPDKPHAMLSLPKFCLVVCMFALIIATLVAPFIHHN